MMVMTEQIAHICHEVNRAYCEAIGDMSQKPWSEADAWQRNSAIAGVKFAINHPGATPKDQHDSWMRDKLADGWCYGPVKNAETKEHPCLVAYDELPPEQRAKDLLFQRTVKAMGDAFSLIVSREVLKHEST